MESIKNETLTPPIALGVDFQSDGVGSRGNSWQGEEGNLYFSFCVEAKQLPQDLLIESTSIYIAWMMREVLVSLNSKIWIKWPNDFYINDKKVGGVITTKIKDFIIGSIGINLLHAPEEFGVLDVQVAPKSLIELFIKELKKNISWKNVFSKYKIEFQNSLKFSSHIDGQKISLQNAKLLYDGSIEVENKRVYSLR
ncbi:MAG TPA: biotin--[acetyl-CoA-carboxylase] ligase [Sulfurospirillum sp. UBA11407]|nr:MAG TPA: biotin--[acetyl-CoA-carboxylase] ligase [Sulfurospirillum sp. UBA11407]